MKHVETQIFSFDPSHIDDNALKIISDGVCVGKIVAFPTETVYGIGSLHTNRETLNRICELKGRAETKPFALYIHNIKQLEEFHFIFPHYFKIITDTFWPGPLTLIIETKHGEKHGIRFPEQPITKRFLMLLPTLLKGTSANRSGEQSITNAQDVYKQFKNMIDFIIDGGVCKYGQESTVIDTTFVPCVVIRKGILWENIEAFFNTHNINYLAKKKVLIVCTGNTCRSPMVSGVLIDSFKRMNLIHTIEIDSCGVYSPFSIAPSQYAIDVLRNEGIDISWHRSKSITPKLIHEADKIIVMTKEHELIVNEMSKKVQNKILVLGISDPLGKGLQFYKETFLIIKSNLEEMIAWIQK